MFELVVGLGVFKYLKTVKVRDTPYLGLMEEHFKKAMPI